MAGINRSQGDQQKAILVMLRLMDRFVEQREAQARANNRKSSLPPTSLAPRSCKQSMIARSPAARRFPFAAKVLIHKSDRYIKGRAVNISSSGMFVGVDRKIFQEREKVRLYIRPDGMNKSYKAIATIVRFEDAYGREGYGLRFSTFSQQ